MLYILIFTINIIHYVYGGVSSDVLGLCKTQGQFEDNSNTEDNAKIDLPSCSCLRQLAVNGAVDIGGGRHLDAYITAVLPGINCIEEGSPNQPSPDTAPKSQYDYIVQGIKIIELNFTENNLVQSQTVVGEDSFIKYLQSMDFDNPFIVNGAKVTVNGEPIYEMLLKTNTELTNICDSYEIGSMEFNILTIIDAALIDRTGCPVKPEIEYTIPAVLPTVDFSFKDQLSCGDYRLDIGLSSKNGTEIFSITFEWQINENCI